MEPTPRQNKNPWLIIVFLIILIVVVYFLLPKQKANGPENLGQLIGDNITITKVISQKQNLQTAGISIPFNQKNSDYLYINAAVDFNQDGKYENYQTPNGSQAELVVINMPAITEQAETLTYSFLLTDEEVLNKNNFPAVVTLSKESLALWSGEKLADNEFKQLTIAKIETEEIDSLWEIAQLENYGAGLALAAEITHSAANRGLPDINQGKNECAPVATANSLIWLAEKNKFTDKMPASQEELISELKNDLKWDPASGVDPADYLAGKNAFMARHKISVVTKKLGGSYEENLFEQIYQEISKGCDVEAVLQYKNSRGELAGAHLVTVAGTYRYSDRSTTESNLTIHDPLSRGESKSDVYRLNPRDNNRLNNYRYGANAFVKEAWSECFVPTEETDTTTPQTPETPQDQPTDNGSDYGQTQPPTIAITDFSFEHQIGTSPCPQTIGTITINGQGGWTITGNLPTWLTIDQTSGNAPGNLTLKFNCLLAEYVSQELSGTLAFQLKDLGDNLISQPVKVSGYIEE